MAVLDALVMLPEVVKLRIVGYETLGHKGYVRQLQKRATQLGVSDRAEFVGTVPRRSDLLSWCWRSDVGLVVFPMASNDINEQAMVGASNKPFDYLSCGLALLVSDLPDWRSMYVDSGYALACDPIDGKSIAAALRWFLEHPAEMRSMGERGRRRVKAAWNYEMQFSSVFERLSCERQ